MLTVFETILEMSLTASIVILVVMLARMLLSKAPKKYAYLLWLVVAFRLCVPFSFESSISIFNTNAIPTFDIEESTQETSSETSSETVSESVSAPEVSDEISIPSVPVIPNEGTVSTPVTPPSVEQKPEVSHPTPEVSVPAPEVSAPTVEKPMSPEVSAPTVETPVVPPVETPVQTPAPSVDWQYTLGVILATVWAIGVVCMLGYGAVTYIKLKKRLQTAVLLYDNVYGSDRIGSPFALGIFRPRIYIPFGMGEESTSYILAHERYHLKRLDHLVKPLSFLILCVHWFNPLCWLAFNRMSLDMELSCDERVLKQFGDENMKKKYSKTLLDFATDNRYPTPAPISFSEGAGAKTRIKHALYWKKPRFWVSAIALLLCAVVLVACAANAVSEDPSKENPNRIVGFGDVPYLFTFTSNGDGTCAITDIQTNFDHAEPFDLVIPPKSPDGDKVVEVDLSVLSLLKEPNVPTHLTAEQYDAIANTIKANTSENSRELKTFAAFYSVHAQQDSEYGFAYRKLETKVSTEECEVLSRILASVGAYSAGDCYRDAAAFLERLPEAERISLQPELFRYLYRSAFDIQKVVLPSKEIDVRQGFLGLSYELTDGSEITPAYEIPIKISATDEQGVVFDQTFNCNLRFDFARPVKEFAVLRIKNNVWNELEEAHTVYNFGAGDHEVFSMSVWSSSATRAVTFVGEDNKKYFYQIVQSYPNGEYTLEDITNTQLALSVSVVSSEQKEETERYAEYRDEHTQSHDLELMISASRPVKDVTIFAYTSRPSSGVWWNQIEITKELYTAERLTRSMPLYFTTDKSIALGSRGIRFVDEDGTVWCYGLEADGGTDGVKLVLLMAQAQTPSEDSVLSASYATEEQIADSLHDDSYLYYIEKGNAHETVAITATETVTNYCFFELNMSSLEFYSIGKIFFAGQTLTSDQTSMLETQISETIPTRGIGYLGKDGEMKYYAICYDNKEGGLYLQSIDNRIQVPLSMTIRRATDAEIAGSKDGFAFFEDNPSLAYNLVVEFNQTVRDARIYKLTAIVQNNKMVYAKEAFRYEPGELSVERPLYLRIYPASAADTYGIYIDGRMYAVFESEYDGAITLSDVTDRLEFLQTTETVLARYELNNGTLYHVQHTQSFAEKLFILHDDGTRTDICEKPWISYVCVSPDKNKIIWNDYEWEYNATVDVYNIADGSFMIQSMDDLGANYTPSFMAWLDNRYFLFVSQYDMGTITRGGDIYVYDTETHEYRMLIDAYDEGKRELMIESFAVGEQSVSFRVYDYDIDIDMYENWTYTLSIDEIYDLIGQKTFTAFLPKDESGFVSPVRVENAADGAEVNFYDQEEIDNYGMGEIVHTLTLTFDRPVTEFSFIKLDDADDLDYRGFVEDQYNLSFGAGDTYTVATYIKDVHINRGIAFRGDDGKMRYYAFRCNMNTGDFGLVEITDQLWM